MWLALVDEDARSTRTALGYLATMIGEVTLPDVGAIALLMIVPLSGQHGVDAVPAIAHGSARCFPDPLDPPVLVDLGPEAIRFSWLEASMKPSGSTSDSCSRSLACSLNWCCPSGSSPRVSSPRPTRDERRVGWIRHSRRRSSRPARSGAIPAGLTLVRWAERRRVPGPFTLAMCPYPSDRSRATCPQSQRALWAGGACWRRSKRHSRALAC
jgi:hypothetical protein